MMRSLLLLLLLATVTATTAASTPTAAEPATAFETPEMVDSMQPRSQAQAQAQAQSASREGKSSDSLLQVRDVAAAAAAPVEVKVRVHLRSLVDIKEVEQSVTAMFVVHMEWTDPKSANVSTQYGEKLDPKANWQPDIGVANAGSLMEVRKESMVLMPKHRVVLSRRIIANVQTQNKYEDFPFDTHSWKVFLMPFSYDATAVKLVPQTATVEDGLSESLTQWTLQSFEAHAGVVTSAVTGKVHSQVALSINVQRHVSFYSWQIILPLATTLLFAYSSFWVPASNVPGRMTLVVMTVLTVLFLNFKVSAQVARYSQLSWMDILLTGCFLFSSYSLLAFVYAVRKLHTEGKDAAERVDRLNRIFFLAAFIIFNIVMYTYAYIKMDHRADANINTLSPQTDF
eukprot:TRINITY_DN67919_c1_g1_i2.p1 TRINITY_DN67919_c1_g1~~TRINITY_DN67919_c1_g1_i2.p1  ORF type:complete len:418 (+),score=208.72 TRINITY_DN67919_c1_g1_i2:60-1256(+)